MQAVNPRGERIFYPGPIVRRALQTNPFLRENLVRLMAARGLSLAALSQRSAVDRRTIRNLLRGEGRVRPHTVHQLAAGLETSVDELFVDPSRLLYRRFDKLTNPAVEEAIERCPELFVDWREADFAELHSRVGDGGPLTVEGAIEGAWRLNRRRELCDKLCLIAETAWLSAVGGVIDAAYETIRTGRLDGGSLPPGAEQI